MEGHPTNKRKVLLDVCRTRWAAHHDSYHHFYIVYVFIVKSLEATASGWHKDKYSDNVTAGWEGKCRTEASGLLAGVEQFEFIITFLTVYLEGITLKLQSTSLDIIHAFHLVEQVKCVYKSLRNTIDSDFTKIYDQAVRIADKVDVQPRSAGRMQHRANTPSESVQVYFLRNMAILFIDHIIMELEAHFTPLSIMYVAVVYPGGGSGCLNTPISILLNTASRLRNSVCYTVTALGITPLSPCAKLELTNQQGLGS